MAKEVTDIKILLAEDDANLGFVVQDNLKSIGYKVTLCSDGEVALKTFASEKFDLCILDVMMPKKDGFAVAQTVRDINKEITVLVELDEKTYEGGENGENHPISWYHDFDGGFMFYTGMGHTDETFTDQNFLNHIAGGIEYAMGNGRLNYSNAKTTKIEKTQW